MHATEALLEKEKGKEVEKGKVKEKEKGKGKEKGKVKEKGKGEWREKGKEKRYKHIAGHIVCKPFQASKHTFSVP